jgi:hypothetical protein
MHAVVTGLLSSSPNFEPLREHTSEKQAFRLLGPRFDGAYFLARQAWSGISLPQDLMARRLFRAIEAAQGGL